MGRGGGKGFMLYRGGDIKLCSGNHELKHRGSAFYMKAEPKVFSRCICTCACAQVHVHIYTFTCMLYVHVCLDVH